MFWGCLTASGSGCPESVRDIMKSGEFHFGALCSTRCHKAVSLWKVLSPPTGQGPPNTHQKEPRNSSKQNAGPL